MVREFIFKDIDAVNNLLKILDFKLEKKSFDNDFLKIAVFEEENIKGVLVYQDLIDILTIDYIVVDENYRRNGIATKLLKYLENKYQNVDNITLEVRESNIEAINFYKNNSFSEVARRKHYYNNEDAILMLKKLR